MDSGNAGGVRIPKSWGEPSPWKVAVDGRVAAGAAALIAVAGALFGLLPALLGARQEPADQLRRGGSRSRGGRGWRRLRGSLLVAEIALTLTLLAGAGVLTNSLIRLGSVDPGFDVTDVTMLSLRERGSGLRARE